MEIVFVKWQQNHRWHLYKQWLYKCCNSINMRSNSKLMTDRKHIKHRIDRKTKSFFPIIIGRKWRLGQNCIEKNNDYTRVMCKI